MNPRSDDRIDLRRYDLGLFLLAFALVCLKSNDALAHPQLWAEDAVLFLKDQLEQRGLLLFSPYAGYLHAAPRLVTWFASFVSAAYTPLIYDASAIAIAAGSIFICAKNLCPLIPPYLVLAAFLLTPTNGEVFGTITNMQWFLQFPLITYCFIAPKASNPISRHLLRGVLAVAALTGPFSIICIALMALSFFGFLVLRVTRRSNLLSSATTYFEQRDFIAWAIVAACAVIQLSFVYTSAPSHPPITSLAHLIVGSLGQAAPLHILGYNPLRPVFWPIGYTAVGSYILLFSKLVPAARIGMFLVLAFAILEVFAAAHKFTVEPMLSLLHGDRYFFALKIVFWWTVFICLKDLFGSERQGANCTLLLLLFICLLNKDHMLRPRFIDYGPAAELRKLDQPGSHTIKFNPAGWETTITPKQ
ncbi:hypothetical protein NYL07_06540 [Xanthomonas translucens pv. translucens]|uniref:hypothetical protein n=1 Tax=Xanthomonas campestris pv. translucens TaxID=343 RepID=UPI001F15C4FB|nr:hypothetical protein [Xanthomonas translucens]MCS3359517.1 hypothetical protein [Xanthomonas translucens pv. translucens]MCS3372074.1 hypothetical protein [Xanthomonas translucens pv. translucens]MCT8289044.1 hypothetical protein [Xanthomonas translucens pv. translucens]MCT8292807.1 hypothetical protein [Xanthomonas translucens pv. translucens]MCT8312831.1 hypothetical protein [Xanthomonas translucens pv. translucens]